MLSKQIKALFIILFFFIQTVIFAAAMPMIAASTSIVPIAAPDFTFPTDPFDPPAKYATGGFGGPWTWGGPNTVHNGVDVCIGRNGEVKAISEGEIRYAGSFGKGWGNAVFIEHITPEGSYVSVYGHIVIDKKIKKTPFRGRGGTIERDVVLGTIDPAISPPHLHFGLFKGSIAEMPSRDWGSMLKSDFPGCWVNPAEYLSSSDILGKWQAANGETVEFLRDGTVIFGGQIPMTGDYRIIEGSRLRIDMQGLWGIAGSQTLAFRIYAGKLTLTNSMGITTEYGRVQPSAGGQSQTGSSGDILGKWQAANGETIEFLKDGTVIFGGQIPATGNYRIIEGSRLRIDMQGLWGIAGSQILNFRVYAGKLTLTNSMGITTEYGRVR